MLKKLLTNEATFHFGSLEKAKVPNKLIEAVDEARIWLDEIELMTDDEIRRQTKTYNDSIASNISKVNEEIVTKNQNNELLRKTLDALIAKKMNENKYQGFIAKFLDSVRQGISFQELIPENFLRFLEKTPEEWHKYTLNIAKENFTRAKMRVDTAQQEADAINEELEMVLNLLEEL